MPDYPSYRFRDNDTGESFDMPWSGPSEPTDRDIDLYRYQQRQRETNSWGNQIKSWIPDPLENAWSGASSGIQNAWTALNTPTSDFPSRMAREVTGASGGAPIPIPLMGYNIPMPARAAEFLGDVYSDQTSPLNIGLNTLSGGGYGLARGLGKTALARIAAMGQTAAGGATAAAGGVNLLNAEDAGDVGSAALQIGLGGLGYKFGRADIDRLTPPKPTPFDPYPGSITDPRRLLPEAASGPRFEAGPDGVRDFSNPSPDPTPPFVHEPELMDIEMPGTPAAGATPDLQMRTVNPRGPSNLQPFEQDASIFQQMRRGPTLQDVYEPTIDQRVHVPQVESVLPTPDLIPPQRSVFGRPIGDASLTPGPVLEPPSPAYVEPATGRPVLSTAQPYDVWLEETKAMGFDEEAIDRAKKLADAFGEDITRSDDLYDFDSYMEATHGDTYTQALEDLVERGIEPTSFVNDAPLTAPDVPPVGPRVSQPPAFQTAAEAKAWVDSLGQPAPVPPAPDAVARVKAVVEGAPTPKPVERPAAPKKPTPDRVLRISRGQDDTVRAVFPDRLHADLFSALGRSKRQIRGERGVIPPDYEGLAKQMGVPVKDVHRIANEYRQKVLAMTKAAPKTAPEGTNVIEMEMPHWGGKAPDMVQAAPEVAPPPPSKRAARQAAWEAEKAQRAAEVAAEAPAPVVNPAEELNAALEARGAAPEAPAITNVPIEGVGGDNVRIKKGASPELTAKAKADLEARGYKKVRTDKYGDVYAPSDKPTLPKSKKARVALVMDELTTLGSKEVVDIANDPAKLLATAKKAGIKSGTLKAAITEFIKNEEGYLQLPTKQQLKDFGGKAFDAANQLRMTSMLSGLALPKSVAGNLGAHVAAALEDRSIEPLKVLLNYKQISKDVADGWKSLANPAAIQGLGKLNLPGRAMGALDFASIKSLQRAGLSEKEAKELLLTGSNAFSAMKGMDSPLAKLFIPFRTTPVNQIMQGFTRVHKHPEIWIGAMAAGAAVGSKVEDKEKLALISAFAGPYALPFLAGAAYATQDFETFGSISPVPEWGLSKTLANPFSAFTQSPGRRWTRSNLGFGKLAEIEKRVERGQRVGSKRGGSKGSRPSR